MELRNYQLKASEFAQKQSCGIFLDVGLGKTLTALHAAEAVGAKQVLILAPKSLLLQWQSEIEKFYPKANKIILAGNKDEKWKVWQSYKTGYLITNYETMRTYADHFAPIKWDVIICDEAQRIANARTKTYKCLRFLVAKRRWALTGTPISNSQVDAFGIFNWINPGMFGNYWQFQARYCYKNRFGAIVGYINTDELQRKIAPHFIRFKADEVAAELPEKIITNIPVELSERERKLYMQIKKEIYHELTGGRADKISLASLGNAIVQITRLQQVTGHASLIGSDHNESSKLETLKDKAGAIVSGGDKVIVFTKFAQMAKIITDHLKPINPYIGLIDGSTPAIDRQNIIELINNKSGLQILVMTNAGSEGLNIQGANHVIFYDFDWSLSKQVQKIGRIHRLGQEKTCFIWNLVATKTIDEYILRKIEKKHDLSEKLITVADVEEILK